MVIMSSPNLAHIKILLKTYVEKSSNIVGLHWDPNLTNLRLLFDPYNESEKEKIAHYFLQVAAIDTAELVSRSENARALMIFLHRALGKDLFEKGKVEVFSEVIQKADSFFKLGPLKKRIPHVLDSVNKYVLDFAKGNLVSYVKNFGLSEEFVKEISDNVQYMGGQRFDHSWMYVQWMTRPHPDLHIFKNFSINDLEIPLTSFIRNVAICLGLCSTKKPNWSNPKGIDQERKKLTNFAKELFPEDPCVVDYPFYILGRWMDGEELCLKILEDHLKFWRIIYKKIKKSPIVFEVASRYESSLEEKVRLELEKVKGLFKFEPYRIPLPRSSNIPYYSPDFVLPSSYQKNGRKIILEPHGVWTPRIKRQVNLEKKTFYVWSFPAQPNNDEVRFVNKLRVFRRHYKNMYYLILIVPSPFRDRIEREYSDIYDEIFEDRDIPKMLYNLKKE